MSRRSATRLTLEINVPVPAGDTQANVIVQVKELVTNKYGHSVLVILRGRETMYMTPRELPQHKARVKSTKHYVKGDTLSSPIAISSV